MTESQLRRNISQVLNKSQALHNIGVQKSHMKFIDERNIDSILEEVLDVSQKSVYFKEDVELTVDLHEKMVPLVSTVSANITLNHTLRSINNLLNIPEEVLAETEQENRSANRLLHLIQEIPKKIPLEEQQVTAIYSNLGIGVAKVTQNSSAKGNTEINSQVLATSIPNISISNLDEPINISFNLINQNANKPQCVYWDESSGLDPHWSLNGCNVSNYIPGKEVTCSCDRLKSFAVLMDVYQKEGEKENANYLSIVSNAGFGISFVCLVFTIIIHVCFRKLWDLMSSKILVSLCSSLAVTYFIFLVGMQSYVQTMAGCKLLVIRTFLPCCFPDSRGDNSHLQLYPDISRDMASHITAKKQEKDTRDGVKEFVIKRKRANPWKFTTGKSSRCGNETENIAAETNF
ncbi:adhesion G-protein coupled receptor G6-like [Octopus vulgaris]|uniref:Adhesion G-protein coupled receptor G6-like n=1 Tax=Octopus vulgaris TaxID=6645 RepID=A0AA36HHA9_OCTVU|nr:adhesion G-protein coupled receptor G6-like [Octopus vulgaris]